VLDIASQKFVRSILLLPPQDPGFGQIPTGVTVTGDGKTLLVTCGGINAVAIVDLPEEKITGYLPTAWFPIALAERQGSLFVASSKGFGARAKVSPKAEAKAKKRAEVKADAEPKREEPEEGAPQGATGYKVSGSLGSVQFVTPAQLAARSEHSRRVALNNGWGQEELPPRPGLVPASSTTPCGSAPPASPPSSAPAGRALGSCLHHPISLPILQACKICSYCGRAVPRPAIHPHDGGPS